MIMVNNLTINHKGGNMLRFLYKLNEIYKLNELILKNEWTCVHTICVMTSISAITTCKTTRFRILLFILV